MAKPAGNQRDIFTIEAEYTLPEKEISTKKQWTFKQGPPNKAKDLILRDCIPLDATVWRIGAWFGYPENRPDSGHEEGIFEPDNGDR